MTGHPNSLHHSANSIHPVKTEKQVTKFVCVGSNRTIKRVTTEPITKPVQTSLQIFKTTNAFFKYIVVGALEAFPVSSSIIILWKVLSSFTKTCSSDPPPGPTAVATANEFRLVSCACAVVDDDILVGCNLPVVVK